MAPSTPTKASSNSFAVTGSIDDYLRNVATQFALPDLITGGLSASNANTIRCRRGIAFLFLKDPSGLQECLTGFHRVPPVNRTISSLYTILKPEIERAKLLVSPNKRQRLSGPQSNESPAVSSSSAAQSRSTEPAITSFDVGPIGRDQYNSGRTGNSDSPHIHKSPSTPTSRPRLRPRNSLGRTSPPASKTKNGNLLTYFQPGQTVPANTSPASVPDIQQTEKPGATVTGHYNQTKPVAPPLLNKRRHAEHDVSEKQAHKQKEARPEQEHWHCRELPHAGLFADTIPDGYSEQQLRFRYECTKYACANGIPLPDLHTIPPEAYDDVEKLQHWLSTWAPKFSTPAEYELLSSNIWNRATDECWPAEISLSGMLKYQTSQDRFPFQLMLYPLREQKKSNRFFRKFGSHRFLKLLVPSSKNSPQYLKTNKIKLEQRLQSWLISPGKQLLGCTWTVVHVKPTKTTNKAKQRFGEFEGHELPANRKLPACKAYSRLDLGFSSTIPTVQFKPNQVLEVPDIIGNQEAEDKALNDLSYDWTDVVHPAKPREMNDGCDLKSAAAARQVWEKLGGTGPVPSAFQARIGPWKGVWMVADPPFSGAIRDNDIWIQVNPTQKKFERHRDDRFEFKHDPLRLSFDVVEYSREPSTSSFYHEYVPILEDRGVWREVCKHVVEEWLKKEQCDAEKALTHSMRLLEWLQSKKGSLWTYGEGTEWCGARKKTQSMMAQTMIQSGFNSRASRHLAQLAVSTIGTYLTGICNDLKIGINFSTSLIGVADPYGVLAPSEISLGFSNPKLAGTPMLSGVDALVSRHPALRKSDIQRVHVVSRPKLAHLVNVVVFPTRGSFPLAGKLQGGDHDGDIFWVCWDAALVEGFRNAPPPADNPKPESYKISVDQAKCGDFLDGRNFSTSRFLAHSFRFQYQDDMLGQVTKYHSRVRYKINTLKDPVLDMLADMHDLLVDSRKNGYSFSELAWTNWRMQNTRFRDFEIPMFENAPTMTLDDDRYRMNGTDGSVDVIDYLVFDVARTNAAMIVADLKATAFRTAAFQDKELMRLWQSVLGKFGADEEINGMLCDLRDQLGPNSRFYKPWNRAVTTRNQADQDPFSTEEVKTKQWTAARQECRKLYRELAPNRPYHAVAQAWLIKSSLHAPCMWDFLKASCLFDQWQDRPAFAFAIAGEILCRIKADSIPRSELVVAPILQRTKIRKRKITDVDYEMPEAEEEAMSDAEQDFVTAVGDSEPLSQAETEFAEDDRVTRRETQYGTLDDDDYQAVAGYEPNLSGSTVVDEDALVTSAAPLGPPPKPPTLEEFDTAPTYGLTQMSEGYSQLEFG